MTSSAPSLEQTSILPLEQDVAAHLIPTDRHSLECRLEVAYILLGACFSHMYSGDCLALTFYTAKARCPDHIDEDTYVAFLDEVFLVADGIRRGNPLSKL